MKNIILFILLLIIGNKASARSESDSLQAHLNKVFNNKDYYATNKELKIKNLKQMLTISNLSSEQRYDINLNLYKEYKKYKLDSAVNYIQKNIEIASQIGKSELKHESELLLAWSYSTKGMYIEAKKILESINKKGLSDKHLSLYYSTYSSFYSQYGQSNNHDPYYQKSELYRDSLLYSLNPTTEQYKVEYATKLLYKRDTQKAEEMLLALLNKTTDKDSERALITYLLGRMYKLENNIEMQKKYFSMSVIADTQNAIKDNASLQSLALAYYETGDIDQAYKFIQSAMNDAIFCNVRYRTVEGFAYYPIINASYQDKEETRKKELQSYLLLISILSTSLIIGIIYIYKQVKKLARTRKELYNTNTELNRLNKDLQNVNGSLQESNHIKEEYIAHFFDLCSTYIDKLEKYRNSLIKKAANNQIEELFKMLKSTSIVENELEELYKNFDVIFLNIYPTFVQDFNKLLILDERIFPKQGELLSTELRIFALIRLGIKDSVKIASFLRYSLRTVYNYRTKVRNKSAVSRDEFEDFVCKIGAHQSEN